MWLIWYCRLHLASFPVSLPSVFWVSNCWYRLLECTVWQTFNVVHHKCHHQTHPRSCWRNRLKLFPVKAYVFNAGSKHVDSNPVSDKMMNYNGIVVYCCHSLSKLHWQSLWISLNCSDRHTVDFWILFCLMTVAVLVQYNNPSDLNINLIVLHLCYILRTSLVVFVVLYVSDHLWAAMGWVQGSELHVLTGIRPSTHKFQSTCAFPVNVSTSFSNTLLCQTFRGR